MMVLVDSDVLMRVIMINDAGFCVNENVTLRGTGTAPVFRKHASISSSEHLVCHFKVLLESAK